MADIKKVVIVRIDGEYICKAYDANGTRYPAADYYTDDKDDAQQTKAAMLEHE